MNSYLKLFISYATGLACASGQIVQLDQPRGPGVKTSRVHSTWTTFMHPRFGFELPIPPGVSAVRNPEAANVPQFQSADRNFVMSAWGGIVSDRPSRVIAAQWEASQLKAGRNITYQRRGQTWFVISGTDVRGVEFYEKFTMHGQHVAFLDITFPKSRIRQFEPWVERIEDGFHPVALRDGPPGFAPQFPRSRQDGVADRVPAKQRNSSGSNKPAPTAKKESAPTEHAPKLQSEMKSAPLPDELPSADKVAGKPGFVYSPFSSDHRMVDVTDIPSGTKVKCPYTMKIFRVP